MFRTHSDHAQDDFFSSTNQLPPEKRKKLLASPHWCFYELIFCNIDETLFECLYSDKASRPKAEAIIQADNRLQRQSAPVLVRFANGYAALLLAFWEVHFSKERQVTLTDFEAETYFQRIGGWNDRQYTQILDILEQRGALTLDKQMHPWILDRRAESQKFWRSLYDELA